MPKTTVPTLSEALALVPEVIRAIQTGQPIPAPWAWAPPQPNSDEPPHEVVFDWEDDGTYGARWRAIVHEFPGSGGYYAVEVLPD